MNLAEFFEKITQNTPISFAETMAVIADNYDYRPTTFRNGLGADILVSEAGTNEGSCKIFAFALLHQLDEETTLNLFGDYYRVDVLDHPEGSDHKNIRNFMKFGWQGISFDVNPLSD